MSAPRWAVLLLRRLARPTRADDVVGDLEEAHRKRVERRGRLAGHILTSIEAVDVAMTLLQGRLRRGVTLKRIRDDAGRRRKTLVSWLDVRLGLRMLIKYPGLTVIGGLGMAVAIAIGAGSFGFFYSYLYPTLGLEAEDRIVAFENWDVVVNNEARRSVHDFVTWRDEMTTVEEMAAFRNVRRNLIVPGGPAQPIPVAQMTASGFRIARVPPFLGRFLLDEDEQPGAALVIVLGYDEWQARFAGEPSAIGREVRLGDTPHTVVGVMPPGYGFPMNHRFWTPLRIDLSAYEPGEGPEIFIFGRLGQEVTPDQAQTELTALGQRAAAAYPDTHEQLRPQVLPYTYPLVDIQDVSTWQIAVMQFLVSLLLVVVAANVAVLAYARTATRRGEIAIRTALGADRWRIVGQLFVEALVLSGGAAFAGLLLAKVGLSFAEGIMAEEVESAPFWMEYGLSTGTVLYAVGLTIVAAVIVGVLPAVHATGTGLNASLSQLAGSSMRLGKTWTVLIVAQMAIAIVALPAAVAGGWSEVGRFAMTKPAFPAEEFLQAWLAMDMEPTSGADVEQYNANYLSAQLELMRRLEAEPNVSRVTFGSRPLGSESPALVEVEGVAPPVETAAGHRIRSGSIDVAFFDAFDVPILTGRPFNAGDTDDEARAVIVNRTFVERILGGANALGLRVRYLDEGADPDTMPWHEVVGVVGDLYVSEFDTGLMDATMYHALAPEHALPAVLSVRVRDVEAAGARERFQAIATAIDPTLRLTVVTAAERQRQLQLAVQLTALVVGLILLSVLLLSAAGIYALMSFTVTQRRREIGIRLALGAHRHRLLGNIFGRALKQLAFGVALGVGLALTFDLASGGDYMAGHGVLVLPAVAGLMLVVGLLAALGPARRGLRVEPTEALRGDG